MQSQLCARCLVRAYNIRPTNTASISAVAVSKRCLLSAFANSFSTSASLSALPPKKKPPAKVNGKVSNLPKRGEKMVRFMQKKRKKPAAVVDRSKRPAIGERKALRKRVVLSNTNALQVKDLEELSQKLVVDPGSVGKVAGIPDDLVDRLRAVQAFKPSQGWSLFSRPAMIVRPETVEYGSMMQSIFQEKKVVRRILVGERMTGKTVMLLQVIAMAMLRRWVVINIPDGA